MPAHRVRDSEMIMFAVDQLHLQQPCVTGSLRWKNCGTLIATTLCRPSESGPTRMLAVLPVANFQRKRKGRIQGNYGNEGALTGVVIRRRLDLIWEACNHPANRSRDRAGPLFSNHNTAVKKDFPGAEDRRIGVLLIWRTSALVTRHFDMLAAFACAGCSWHCTI